jgi:YVTN family beta-propeller protein
MNMIDRALQMKSASEGLRVLLFGAAVLLALALSSGLSRSASTVTRDGSKRAEYALPEDDQYMSPIQMVLSKDGRRLYVVCENSNELLLIDTTERKIAERIKVGTQPFGITLSPDESRIYVSNRRDDTISVLHATHMQVVRTIPVGDDPHAIATDTTGKYLYVANLSSDDVSVVDTSSFIEVKRLMAGKSPFGIALAPDGRYLYVSNQLSNPVPFRTAPVLELTVIDTQRQIVVGRRNLVSTVIAQDIAVSPDNRFVVVALELPKNLLPETQVYQGWMVTHGFAIAETGPSGRIAYFLLDEANLYYADPYGVAFSPDGQRLFISSSGVNVVSEIGIDQIQRLLKMQDGKIQLPEESIARNARNLGLSAEYVQARYNTQHNPKDLVSSPDGRYVYVANRLSDTIQVLDTSDRQASAVIDLGGPRIETLLRRGARLFNYSSISFQKQLSCNTCHPENLLDGLTYDIVAAEEGMGRSLVDNRTMRGIAFTEPFKWSGKNPTISRQDGPRAAQLFFRSHGFEPDDLKAITSFVESIPLEKNRYPPLDGQLNEFQKRGKAYFERAYTRDGRYIPVANRCITCHPAPYYTNHMSHDVGSQAYSDDFSEFDVPQLSNVYENAPYMHDGRCYSLEEIWTVFNPGDTHGMTNDMAKENLNDLIEYIKTLSAAEPVSDKDLFASLFAKSKEGSFRLPIGDLDSFSQPAARYVGNEVCGTCHAREYKRWLGTRHARTWVMLGMPELAPKVAARFDRKPSNPQNSGICLKCHGTAADAPAEYRAATFHVEEGVQCEQCHGPGEKYAKEDIMKDKQKAISMGLQLPSRVLCMNCHQPKPSHEFMHRDSFDFDVFYKKIVHAH